MRKFFIKSITPLALTIVLVYLIHFVILQGVRLREGGDYGVWNAIVDGKVNADILITGSSRAINHYNPEILHVEITNQAFNIGLEGSALNFQLPLLETYLQYNTPPRVIIQNLDFFMLTEGQTFDAKMYIPYLNNPSLYDFLITRDPKMWHYKYIPLYGVAHHKKLYTEAIKGYLSRGNHERKGGFTGLDRVWSDEFDNFKQENEKGLTAKIEESALYDFKRLIKLANDHHIQLIFVYSPEYQEAQYLVSNREEVIHTFAQMANENGIMFLDYSDHPISKEKAYFTNSQHLNLTGATIFSQEIARLLTEHSIANSKTELATGHTQQ